MNSFKNLLDHGSWFFAIGQIVNKNYDRQPYLRYNTKHLDLADYLTWRFRIGGRDVK